MKNAPDDETGLLKALLKAGAVSKDCGGTTMMKAMVRTGVLGTNNHEDKSEDRMWTTIQSKSHTAAPGG